MRKSLLILSILIIQVFITPDFIYSQKLPNLWLRGLDGIKYNLDEFSNNVPIMINFWSLSCAPCQREMRHLDEFAQTYTNETFQVISINIDSPKSLSRVKSYIQSKNYAFQIFLDPEREVFTKLGGRLLPYSVFVRKNGIIESRRTGYAPGDEITYKKIIKQMIAE